MAVVKSLIKVDIGDEKTAFIACNYEYQKKLHALLIDINRCEAFSGYATDIDLRSQAASIRMSFNDFISLSTKALTHKDCDGCQFLYSFENSYEDFVLKWKSVDNDETIITIGCIKMKKEDYGTVIKDLFSMLSEELLNLNKKLCEIEANLNNAEKEKTNALNLLSDAINVKDSIEEELYAKFIVVLNEKKRKIRELKQNTCKKLPQKKTTTKRMAQKKFKNEEPHQISDSSDEIDGDLQDINVPGPSNAKRDNSLLFFDDDEPPVPVTPSKMRKRNTTKPVMNSNFQELISDVTAKPVIRDSESEDELFNNL